MQPEDALRAVRTAITLGAVVPDMRAQADAIAGDLADLMRVRKDIIGERQRLARDLALLGREQLRLNLLIDERQKREAAAAQALDAERRHAADLAHQVGSLQDLIAKLEANLDSATLAARDAATRQRRAGRSSPRSTIPAASRRRFPSPPHAGTCACR